MHSPARGDNTLALTLAPRTAAAAVLVLWVPYTVYFAVDPGSVPGALLGLAPGVLGVGLLLGAGFGPADCFLRVAPLSRAGGAALAGVAVLLVPIVAAGRWVGWDWLGVLVLAPLSGVSQELYFRSSLLPALLHVCGHRAALALALHGVLFTLWHLRTLVLMPPPRGRADLSGAAPCRPGLGVADPPGPDRGVGDGPAHALPDGDGLLRLRLRAGNIPGIPGVEPHRLKFPASDLRTTHPGS